MLAQLKDVRFNGDYCGEPKPPTPPPAPVPLALLNGNWTQGTQATQIQLDTAALTLTVSHVGDSCCKWNGGTGTVTPNGATIALTATGPNAFSTSERGTVTSDGTTLTIAWTPTGGEKKSWADWTKKI